MILFACLFYGMLPIDDAAATQMSGSQQITAEAVDAGDYYLGLDGQPVHFYRKKDVYLKLDSIAAARKLKHQQTRNESATTNISQAARTFSVTPAGFSRIENHRWNGLEILKRNPGMQDLAARGSATNHSATEYAPVFTSESGAGEYLILPDIMISFNSKAEAQQYKQAMLEQFGMTIKNQMMFSETDFVLAFETGIDDYSKVFSTTRELMALPYIKWAEPNMQVKLQRTDTPDPNDYLYREQWGLENWGDNGTLCVADGEGNPPGTGYAADIDANDAWDYMKENGLTPSSPLIIAVIDDGVQLDHPDLPIIDKPASLDGNFGGGNNLCFDDSQGCNFGDYYLWGAATGRTYNREGPDVADPHLGALVLPEPKYSFGITRDTHGTRVAGIAAAVRNNSIGISGSAYSAEILPVRLNFYAPTDCIAVIDALSYAAKYADIISNSWKLESKSICPSTLDSKIHDIATGNVSFKRGTKGTPILFGSGNAGTGWQKVTISVPSSGTLKFTLHKDWVPDDTGEDAVWIDDVTVPGGTVESISSTMPTDWSLSLSGGNSQSGTDVYGDCTASASAFPPVIAAGNHAIGGSGHAIKLATAPSTCQFLEIANVSAGTLEFWAWVSIQTWGSTPQGDLFRVYLDNGITVIKIGTDMVQRGEIRQGLNTSTEMYHNQMSYPALHTDVIAVGASNDGADAQMEDRAYYSQYADGTLNLEAPMPQDLNHAGKLDVLAPGVSIRSTEIEGQYGYVSGTSASTPMVAGVIANMLAIDDTLTLAEIKSQLHNSADKIGPNAGEFQYNGSGFNGYYGYGRVNAYKSAQLANGVDSPVEAPELCTDPNPDADDDDWLILTMPAILAAALKNK